MLSILLCFGMMIWDARVVDDRSVWDRWVVAGGLDVWRGDVVRVVDSVAGWLWCRTAGGSFGWVSAESVEFFEGLS